MKKGFTLAEVLITLSIIGIVSVLTIPSMVKYYKYKLYASALKKTYSQLVDAAQQAMNDELTNDFFKTTSGSIRNGSRTEGAAYFLKNYFKIARENCGNASPSCVANVYTSTGGATMTGQKTGWGYCAQNTNGVSFCMSNWPDAGNNGKAQVMVDINGQDPPNITGVDAFVMSILSDGSVVDWSNNPDVCNTKQSSNNHASDYATGCLTKVMQAGWVIEPIE